MLTLLAVAAIFAQPTPGGAAEKKTAAKATGAAKPTPMFARVDAIDTKGGTFTTRRKNGVEVKYVVTDKTEIMNGEAAAKLGDIKVGEYVSGSMLKKSDTESEVVKITRFGAPMPKAPIPASEAKPVEK